MKTDATGLLIPFLATTRNPVVADLFTFTLKKGTVLRYTSGDRSIVFGGNTFIANDAQIERGTIHSSIGSEVDQMGIRITASQLNLVAGTAILKSIDQKEWHGADVRVETAYMPTYGDTSKGTEIKFIGRVADVPVIEPGYAELVAKSLFELLASPLPMKILQPSCSHTLYDAGCGVVRATFTESPHSVTAGSTVNKILMNSSGQVTGFFDLGVVIFLTGALAGKKFSVKKHTSPNTLNPYVPLPVAPSAGDTFSVAAGCDRLQATCSTKFGNLPNFGGFPYVPKPETAI
jgi:uncharacterized phage protein (TIGR02218 family)